MSYADFLTLIQRAPAGHQAGCTSWWIEVRGQADRCDPFRQNYWRTQLHQSNVVIKRLWVKLHQEKRIGHRWDTFRNNKTVCIVFT